MKNVSSLLVCFFISASLAFSARIGDGSGSGSELAFARARSQAIGLRLGRECGDKPRADVVFVLDTSNSISHQGYREEIGIVLQFVEFIQQENTKFSAEDIRLAIIEFASDVEVELTFAESISNDYESLKQRIRSLRSNRLVGTETNTAKALEVAKTYFDYNERKNARKYTIVVTDGKCSTQYLESLEDNAKALRSKSIFGSGQEERQVWSIGVGEADDNELKLISGDAYRVLHIDNFNEIRRIKEFFRHKIRDDFFCPPVPTGCQVNNGGCEHICDDSGRHIQCKCYPGFTLNKDGHHCDRLCVGRHDVVIILDTSNSVSHEDFSDELNLVEQFVRFFEKEEIDFSHENARLAIIQFGSEVRMDLSFHDWTNGNHHALVKRIKQIKRLEGIETNTAEALLEAKTYLDRNGRKDVPKYAIVVTDGECTDKYLPQMYKNAAALRRDKVTVFGIGVGAADEQELNIISGDSARVKKVEDFKSSQDFQDFFHFDVRNAFICSTPLIDVIFVLDSSNSLRREDFANELDMVIQFIRDFEKEGIRFSPTGARLAIIQFGSVVQTDLTFDQSTFGDYASLVRRVKAIPKLYGAETNTAKALRETRIYLEQNQRSNARKYTIVVTDGRCSGDYRPQLPANAAALGAVGNVWSIGVGGDQFRQELIEISGNPRRVLSLSISDYEILPENFLSPFLEEMKQR